MVDKFRIEAKVLHLINKILRDFESYSHEELNALKTPYDCRVPLRRESLPIPMLIRYLLVDVLRYTDLGREEKTAWRIPFLYRKFNFVVSLEKFGLRLYCGPELTGRNGHKLTEEIVKKLSSAIKILEKYHLKNIGENQIAKGNVTMLNSYHKLYDMYFFFRAKAGKCFEDWQSMEPQEPFSKGWSEWAASRLAGPEEGFYNTVAMVNSFFSWLEHIFIIILPFTAFDPSKDDLSMLMGSRWGDKYKKLFDVSVDKNAKKYYDELLEVRDQYRNRVSHGFFERGKGSLFFHLSGAGPVPLRPSTFTESIHYKILPIEEKDYDQVTKLFDEVEDWLANGKFKYGIKYAKSGLQIPFNERSLRKFREAMSSSESFENMIEYDSRMEDMHDNMDW